MRILIIEDDSNVAQTLADTLELNGFKVEVAADGQAGWEAALRQIPVLILTDIAMPRLSGLELLRRVQEHDTLRHVPVVILSAKTEREDIRRGMELGAADYISKPFVEGEIVRAVTTQLSKKSRFDEVDAFAHTVAHDLRSPLATLFGRLELLRSYVAETPMAQRQLVAAEQSARRLNAIIDDLLVLACVHRQKVDMVPLDMAAIAAEAQERLESILRERRAQVQWPEQWHRAVGHAPWVALVWTNLISNAAKYGGSRPELQTGSELAPDGGFVRFWVRDHGPGLSESDQDKLFTPFATISAARLDGHGLGLSIVRRVVGHLGGRCGGENMPGGGCRFWFDLPLAPPVP